MIDHHSKTDTRAILRAADQLRRQLAGQKGEMTFTIRGGHSDGGRPDETIAVAYDHALQGTDRDLINSYFNDWTAAGCDCTQPVNVAGSWRSECTCSSNGEEPE